MAQINKLVNLKPNFIYELFDHLDNSNTEKLKYLSDILTLAEENGVHTIDELNLLINFKMYKNEKRLLQGD